jgi:hypothetical protein
MSGAPFDAGGWRSGADESADHPAAGIIISRVILSGTIATWTTP